MYRSKIFLTSAIVGEWSALHTGRFTPRERAPGTHWMGVWVDPRAGLEDVEKRKFFLLPGLEIRPLGRPARSQSLYRLPYPGCTGLGRLNKILVRKPERKILFGRVFFFFGGMGLTSPGTAATSGLLYSPR
jgi:hypothetical protein